MKSKLGIGTKVFCHTMFPMKGTVSNIIHDYFTVTDVAGNEWKGITLSGFKSQPGIWFEVVA